MADDMRARLVETSRLLVILCMQIPDYVPSKARFFLENTLSAQILLPINSGLEVD